jgi:hypothetical protein
MYSILHLPALPRQFHDRIYAGEILRLDGFAAFTKVVEFTRQFLEDRFHPHIPVQLHRQLSHEQQVEQFAAATRDYARLDEVKRLWRCVFEDMGLDPAATVRDRLHLRFQPHQPADTPVERTRATATVRFHRDTWGTNLYAQVNWWAPVYPLTAGRTMAMYPSLWSKALQNSSPTFDFSKVLEKSRCGENVSAYDGGIPRLLEEVAPELALPVVIEPGTLIAFSAAHAHAGVPNHTDFTRISLETRTLSIEDFCAGRGAPNVDGHAPWMSPGLFRRVTDGVKLPDLVAVKELEPILFGAPLARFTLRESAKREEGVDSLPYNGG